GTSVVNAELNRASQRDGIRFYLLVTVFIVAATYLSLRTWRDVVVVLSVVTATALPPMAALALLKIPYNMVSIMLPPILITLSVCDVVHVINAFHFERRRLGPAPAIIKAIDGIWTPCLWTSIVTVGGLLTLCAIGISRVEVDTDYTKFFGQNTYITRAYPQLSNAGYGQSPVSIMLRFADGMNYASGDTFARIGRFEDRVRKDPAVLKLLTLTDLLDRADLAFNGADRAA